jgi:hypothetical protein
MQTTTWVIPSVSKYFSSKIQPLLAYDDIQFFIRLLVDKNTTRFTPSVAKGRRHSAPAARAKLSNNNNDLSTKKGKKGNERKQELEIMSEPERK